MLQLSKAENRYFRQYGKIRPEFYTKAEPTQLQTKLFFTIPLPKESCQQDNIYVFSKSEAWE